MSKALRLVFVLVVLASMVLSLTGCPAAPAAPTAAPATKAPAATTAPAATAAPAATKAPAATQAPAAAAKALTILMQQEPDTLFPSIGAMLVKEEVLYALWSDCVVLDDKNNYIPWGCESVPTVDNGGAKLVGAGADQHLEATFKLKKGWKWHDGTPVTSKDVKFSIELMQNPDFLKAEQRDLALKVAEVQTPDDQTAVVVFMSQNQAHKAAKEGWKFKNAEFYEDYDAQVGPVLDPLYMLAADAVTHMFPQHILSKVSPKDYEKSDFARKPVGNGPYKFKEWVPAQQIVVEAADNGIFKPQIPTVIYKLIADSTGVVNGMAAGEGQVFVQTGMDVDQSPDLDKLAQQGKLKPYYIPASAWEHIDFNLNDPLLSDKNVRKAIAHAVDRKTIVDKLLYGKSQVMHTWIAPPSWALDDASIIKYDYNPQKAKDLLAQAGWKMGASGVLEKDGKPFRVKLQTTTAKIRQAIGPLVQANLKDVGIAIEPEYLPGRGLFETNGPLVTRKFQMAIFTWISNPDPDPTSTYLGKNCPDGANYPCFKNAEFDKLCLQQASELSQATRKPMLAQMEKIWTDELPSLPLFQRLTVSGSSPKLQNFKPTSSNTPETWNIHEWFLPAS